MKPLNPWISLAVQLQARGLQVDNSAAALDYLECLGHYCLSGYWYLRRGIDQAASNARKAVCLDSPSIRFGEAGRVGCAVETQGIPSW
ncbi:hypothetical protein KBK24_0128460 [Burkholderia sp. K24]|nr:hypothetical protein KBK24_0128460 [Burkholderia sp. K24]